MRPSSTLWTRIKENRNKMWGWIIVMVIMSLMSPICAGMGNDGLYVAFGVIIAVAIAIAMQEFAYLFYRHKVLYHHGMPVPLRRHFLHRYCQGIGIFLCALLVSAVITIGMASLSGALRYLQLGRYFTTMVLNLVLFLVVYNLSVVAVMLTGRLYVALALDAILLVFVNAVLWMIGSFRACFYETLCMEFNQKNWSVSFIDSYFGAIKLLSNGYKPFESIIPGVITSIGIMLIWYVVSLIFAYKYFKKRPIEAAESTVAFYSSRILIKLMVGVAAGLVVSIYVYMKTAPSIVYGILGLVAGTIISSVLVEFVYSGTLRGALRKWGSVVVALIFAILIFMFFGLDIARYDRYVPNEDLIESFAIINELEEYYTQSADFDAYPEDYASLLISQYQYVKDNMFLQDIDSIIALADKSVETGKDNMRNPKAIDVLYRLKTGTTTSRRIWVDISDADNDIYMNRLIGPAYYKQGIWQAMGEDIPDWVGVVDLRYEDSVQEFIIDPSQTGDIINMWRMDMVGYDYSRISNYIECGCIRIRLSNGITWSLPVYENFTEINNYLEAGLGYQPLVLNSQTVEAITIIDNEDINKCTRYESDEYIDMIAACLEVNSVHKAWLPDDYLNRNYKVEIKLNEGYTKEYGISGIATYRILGDSVAELKEAGILPE